MSAALSIAYSTPSSHNTSAQSLSRTLGSRRIIVEVGDTIGEAQPHFNGLAIRIDKGMSADLPIPGEIVPLRWSTLGTRYHAQALVRVSCQDLIILTDIRDVRVDEEAHTSFSTVRFIGPSLGSACVSVCSSNDSWIHLKTAANIQSQSLVHGEAEDEDGNTVHFIGRVTSVARSRFSTQKQVTVCWKRAA